MKKALLVGINTYPSSPLRGCVNDCLLMHKILTEKFDFKSSEIKLLLDAEATKINILSYLNWLVKESKEGDTLYFHYSGHGSQVIVTDRTNTEESDGLDEILCPYDLNWNDPLRDNDLNTIISKIPDGVNVLFVLDCCHSGTGLRNTFEKPTDKKTEHDWVNRFIPPPPSNLLKDSNITLDESLHFVHRQARTSNTQFLIHSVNQGNAILISGCRDDQVSADAWIGGRYHGALTYTLATVLNQHDYEISFRKLIEKVNSQLQQSRFEQQPQLESKKKFFDLNFLFKKK